MKNQSIDQTNELIESFKDLVKKKEELSSVTSTTEIEANMRKIFIAYKNEYLSQSDFVNRLKSTNPNINRYLRRFLNEQFVVRVKIGKKFMYVHEE